ncbi:hypothetical protein SCHPADRAFT_906964 [Schizopora paradoxa]|uniref:GIT Spa2 homology (SHD) domain-containing protein n=1 Tax=Schizopora paradoxa TaxID=27342 RepID=A0A0H2REM0_9AGAM|nr:hypothetical protein SCHPADRAFT_906964 [Schizopora paradoxa]
MKRNPSLARAPSPTNTTFSGISNYRAEPFKQLQKPRAPVLSLAESRAIARLHFEEISSYLDGHLANEPANARASARDKLTKLTKQQFQELSTDVYDELLRRKNNGTDLEVPFLPVREDFHPKRNQARQKLATLPTNKFKDLSGDVFFELGRRHPEFREPETLEQPSPGSAYDDMDVPSPDFPQSSRPKSASGNSSSGRRPSEDGYRRRPSEDMYGNRSEEGEYGATRRPSEDAYSISSRRKPSQDIVMNLRNEERRRPSPDIIGSNRRPSEDFDRDRDLTRKPSSSVSIMSDSTGNLANAQREMIVPTKSTIAEENIEVPYGQGTESDTGRSMRLPSTLERSPDDRTTTFGDTSEGDSPRVPLEVGGLNGLSARLRDRGADEDEDDEDEWSGQGKSGEEYYDKMSFGRASVASDRSLNLAPGARYSSSGNIGRLSKQAMGDDLESVRRDYEFKIATLQNRLASLERELENVEDREKRLRENAGSDTSKVGLLENQIKQLQEAEEESQVLILNLRREVSELKEESGRQQDLLMKRAEEDASEIASLRLRCQELDSLRGQGVNDVNSDTVDQLQSDLEGLVSELNDLSQRNDELMNAKDSDLAIIQNLDAQLKDYKRKYESAKTELRSLKATSQLFSQAPKMDSDQLPVSADGGILDIHLTAFLTSVDNLLTAGRSQSPRRVLSPMMAVVNAVTAIVDDLRNFERNYDRHDVDLDVIQNLLERAEATLSNLVAVANSHATSMGMAPVSLLDAAASHLSATVTEIGKTVLIRRASRIEQEQFRSSSGAHQRNASLSRRRDEQSPQPQSRPSMDQPRTDSLPRRVLSPLGISSAANNMDEDSVPQDNAEEAWSELKPYLEAQSETIVYAIQNVLSGVRSQTPASTLTENLTQIITIVSSIVAVCKDNLPPANPEEGMSIIRELSEHANKLSEVQSQPEMTKESRQVMAKSSFAIANAMKGLMKL